MNTHHKIATLVLTAGIALFGLAGCSRVPGGGPYAGKGAGWFYLHPKAIKAQKRWCNQHLGAHETKAQRNSVAYSVKHFPTCYNAIAAKALLFITGPRCTWYEFSKGERAVSCKSKNGEAPPDFEWHGKQ